MRCPICGSGLAIESHELVWVAGESKLVLAYHCESCGREFDKPSDKLAPKDELTTETTP
ncbi:MAG: hypothetical protein ABSF00_08640 [Candidatus Bathyarchaeia archaeon]|jgi:DNA-directed RNA polymerase subunit RPC12/RpoP